MTSTLHLSAYHIRKLQTIAERLGYLADRGAATGKGSASKLMRAIADRRLIVIDEDELEKLKRDAALTRQEVTR